MQSARILRIVVVAVAVVLHLAAHASLDGGLTREPLPEDAPALLANRALSAADQGVAAALSRAAVDPDVTWDPAGDVVGRTRFRPVSAVAFVLERAAFGARTGSLVALVSWALHVIVALMVVELLTVLGASVSARWIAGLLAAATPVALAAAAWPARQPVLLATALGVVALRLLLAPRRGVVGLAAGGALLALAFLAHEAAAGLAAAALVLALAPPPARRGRSARRIALAVALPLAAAVAWRWSVLAGRGAGLQGGDAGCFADAAVGMLTALAAPLLPARLHLVAEPWSAAPFARIAGPLLLAVLLIAALRRVRTPGGALWLAALAAASPVLATAFGGGTPFHGGYAVAVAPVLFAAVAVSLAAAASRGGALRVAAVAAAALLVAASVAATLTSAASFRRRASFIALAARAAPRSVVVAAWHVGDVPGRAPRPVAERGAALLAALPQAYALAARLVDDQGGATPLARRLARDPPVGIGVAAALAAYVRALTSIPAADMPVAAPVLLQDVERVAEAATAVAPDWDGAWLMLVRARTAIGARAAALAAARRAATLAPQDPARLELVARLALNVGRTETATRMMGAAAELEERAAEREGRSLRREHVLLYARALAADASASGLLVEFDWALRLLLPLFDEGDRGLDLRAAVYDVHLRWGDALASLDRTAMARVAYRRAVRLGGAGSEAGEHLRWLEDRLRVEMRTAEDALDRAAAGEGNVANALLGVAIAKCRAAEWDAADAVFRRIEEGQGGMNAALRYARALHRYAAREDQLELAASELRAVLEEDATFHEARFRLAGVLLDMGRVDDAAREYRRAAREGAAYEWAIEALEIGQRLEALQRR